MTSPDELRTKLETGLASLIEDREQIDADIASVQKALAALNGKPSRVAPKRAPRKPKSAAPVEVIPAGKLVRLVSDFREGVSAPALAKEANADLAQVNTLLRELEAEGKVHRTGERRATRWFAGAAIPHQQLRSKPLTAGLRDKQF
jgi:predicted Rossmann fold nucleotide-binding protein DprA/Smf involved in DNA uptake